MHQTGKPAKVRQHYGQRILRNYELYLFLLPAVAIVFIFRYIPMYGVQMAFQNFVPAKGIAGSDGVGLLQFEKFFNSYQFKSLITNTLFLSAYDILAGFPVAIMLALLLNQMQAQRFKRTLQTVTYMPHFISTVVMVGIIQLFLSPASGLYAQLMKALQIPPTNLMGNARAFRHIYVWSGVWQHAGWDSIIYIAALSAVDPSLYEAATVDGANKWHKLLYIDVPSLIPTMVILLILRLGNVMSVGFEKVYLMQNPLNTPTSEILSTYVYKLGIENSQYSYSAAVDLFNTVVNFTLLIIVNFASKKIGETSLW